MVVHQFLFNVALQMRIRTLILDKMELSYHRKDEPHFIVDIGYQKVGTNGISANPSLIFP